MKRLYAILLLLAEFLSSTKAQNADSSVLPTPSECGHLNEEYLYSENISTNLEEFPWMARIAYKNENQETFYPCQGVLISKRYVITVAHCFINKGISAFAVVLGDWDTANNITEIDCNKDGRCAPVPKQFDIEEIVVSPNFQSSAFDNDIALLRLDKEVVFSAYIRPICLPTAAAEESQQLVAAYYHLAGFGRRLFNEDTRWQIFKTLSHIKNLQSCRNLTGRKQISESNLCANCQVTNDLQSGSALMGVRLENFKPKNFYLVAMLSSGSQFCGPKHLIVLVRISSHIDWLKYNMVE